MILILFGKRSIRISESIIQQVISRTINDTNLSLISIYTFIGLTEGLCKQDVAKYFG